VRAVFLTRPATAGSIAPTRQAGDRVGLDSAFVLEFDRPIDPATLRGALVARPALEGTLEPLGRRTASNLFVFTPAQPLASNGRYELSISGAVRDVDGAALANAATVVVQTVAAPSVIRFRPRNETSGIDRGAVVSVRFTEPMDRATTAKAFSLSVGGKAVAGKVTFAEGDTVLVFDPSATLPYGKAVVARVAATASSAVGVPLARATSGTFTTAVKPAVAPAIPKTAAPAPDTKPAPPPTGAGAGTWTAVEAYYLDLMNCTRTGGLVSAAGVCLSPGGRAVAALALDAEISAKVSRPYAKVLASRNLCSHFANGGPDDRLRKAGYTSYNWAENLGCRSGNPSAAVLGSHLFFQAERSTSPVGGHYRNLMNAKYDRVGIGVWVYGGRVRLVIDFYHP
ncbi:MAG: Ig-like domain-containing protein, partial [Chloroflexota bacterium]|nr:Ig-like domain-containing protein [Chloroflexota bacterium]